MQAETSLMSWKYGYRVRLTLTFEQNGLRITPHDGPTGESWFLDGPDLIDAENDGWSGWYGGFPDWLMNDGMTMPVSFTGYLRRLWRNWKDGRVNEQEANRVAMLLFGWLDTVNQSEPDEHLRDYR